MKVKVRRAYWLFKTKPVVWKFPHRHNPTEYIKYVLRYSPKWKTMELGGEEWLSKVLFSLRKEKK